MSAVLAFLLAITMCLTSANANVPTAREEASCCCATGDQHEEKKGCPHGDCDKDLSCCTVPAAQLVFFWDCSVKLFGRTLTHERASESESFASRRTRPLLPPPKGDAHALLA